MNFFPKEKFLKIIKPGKLFKSGELILKAIKQ